MPIYEYQCKTCKKNFELLQKITDEPLGVCPKCGKKAKRLISQTSFMLKGSGWYKDGYSGKSVGGKNSSSDKKTEKKETKTPSKCEGCKKCDS